MMSFFLAAAAAAIAITAAPSDPPPTTGFNAAAMADFAGKQAVETPDIGLLTSALRQCLANDPRACMDRMRDTDRAALFAAIGPMDDASAPLVAYLTAGALVVTGGNQVTGLYNPVADAWLIVRWEHSATGTQIGGASLVDGAALRGDTARWWEAGGSYGDALGAAWKTSQAAFLVRFAANGNPPDLAPSALTVAQRLVALTHAADAVKADTPVMTALENGQHTLIVDAGADAALQVSALPASVRRTTRLTTVIRRPNGLSGVFVSPLRSDLLLVVNLDNANHVQSLTPIAFPEVQP